MTKKRKTALYAAVTVVCCVLGLALAAAAVWFLLAFFGAAVLLARAYGDLPPAARPNDIQFLLEVLAILFGR